MCTSKTEGLELLYQDRQGLSARASPRYWKGCKQENHSLSNGPILNRYTLNEHCTCLMLNAL